MTYEYDNNNKLDSIEVTLAMGCSLDCHYCPQKKLLSRYYESGKDRASVMSFDTFKKCISKVKGGGTICFSGMCEPFKNPECDDMILHAYRQGFRIMLLTTLVGFRKESISKLKEVEFDEITLHIPDAEGHSKFCVTEEYLDILKHFINTFSVTAYSCHGKIHPLVEPIVQKDKLILSEMLDRGGNMEWGSHYNPKGEIICMAGANGHYGNWTPEALPDGTLTLCCTDYGMKHILGNLATDEVQNILNGEEYKRVCHGMKTDETDILCRKCNAAIEVHNTPAYRFKSTYNSYIKGNLGNINLKQKNILKKFQEADTICIFGLGKLFWNNYFNQRWKEVLQPDFYCDNNEQLWGNVIDKAKIISPKELQELHNVLVITHVSNDENIKKQLMELGLDAEKTLNIYELYQNF